MAWGEFSGLERIKLVFVPKGSKSTLRLSASWPWSEPSFPGLKRMQETLTGGCSKTAPFPTVRKRPSSGVRRTISASGQGMFISVFYLLSLSQSSQSSQPISVHWTSLFGASWSKKHAFSTTNPLNYWKMLWRRPGTKSRRHCSYFEEFPKCLEACIEAKDGSFWKWNMSCCSKFSALWNKKKHASLFVWWKAIVALHVIVFVWSPCRLINMRTHEWRSNAKSGAPCKLINMQTHECRSNAKGGAALLEEWLWWPRKDEDH